MPTYDLGTARGRIDIDTGSAERNLGRVARQQDQVTRGGGNAQRALRTTGLALAGVGALAAVGFGKAIQTAASFEKRISAIGAVSGASGTQLDAMRKKALQLGADTAFSANDAAVAMEELAKAGLSTTDILSGAADATVSLAAAGEIDLPQAATIAANAMNQFNLSAKDMPKVADLIAGAANASAIDVGDFGLSMQQAGATANLVGLGFDDLAVSIAAMGNAGIRGSDAGTSLKTFLSNLQPTTLKQTNLMKELGIVTEDGANKFFDAGGKIRKMSEISGVLADALKGQTQQQKAMTLETLFGSDAIRAAAIITNTGAKGFENLAAKMDKVKAADVAKARMDNFAGSVEQLKGSLDTLLITIGTLFLPLLRKIVDFGTKVLNMFSSLSPSTQKLIVTIIAGTAAFLAFAGGILLAIKYARDLRAFLQTIKFASFLTNPIGLAIAAIIALGVGFFLLYKHSKAFRDIVNGIFEFFQPAIQATIRFVQNFIKQFQNLIKVFQSGDDIVSGVSEVIDSMFGNTGALVGPVHDITMAITEFWRWLQKISPVIKEVLVDDLTVAGNFISKTLWPAIQKIVQAFGGWGNVLKVAGVALALMIAPVTTIIAGLILAYVKVKAFRDIVDGTIDVVLAIAKALVKFGIAVVNGTKAAINWLNKNVFPVFEEFGELVAAVVDRIVHVINFLWPVFEADFKIIMLVVKNAVTIISALIGFFVNTIQVLWRQFGDNIVATIQIAWGVIKTVVETALGIIKGIIMVVTGLIRGDWGKVWDGIKQIFGSVWNGMRNLVKLALRAIQNSIDGTISAIRAIFQIGWDGIKRIFSTALEIIKRTVSGALDAIVGFVTKMPGRIGSAIHGLWSPLSAGLGVVARAIGHSIDVVVGWVTGLPKRIADAAVGMWDGFWDTFKATINLIIRAWNALEFTIPGFKLPFPPHTKFGDFTIGVPDIPELATGAVITQPTLALLGEHTKALPEIVTPERLLRSIVNSSLAKAGGAGGDTFNFDFTFGDLTDPTVASAVKTTVTSGPVLRELVRAVRSGKKVA